MPYQGKMKKLVLIAAALVAVALPIHAQSNTNAPSNGKDPLFQTVAGLDKKLFDAYNACDLKTLSAMVDDNLEFYHDQSGLAVGKQPFLESTQKYICGKVTRELVASSLEVHPLKTYGAVEIGTHRFLHPSDPNNPPGEARFVMLWQQKGEEWKLTRVISYDHGAAK